MQQNTKEKEKKIRNVVVQTYSQMTNIIITIIKAIKLGSKVQMQHSVWTHAIKHPPLWQHRGGCGDQWVTGDGNKKVEWKIKRARGKKKHLRHNVSYTDQSRSTIKDELILTKPLIGGDSVIALCV